MCETTNQMLSALFRVSNFLTLISTNHESNNQSNFTLTIVLCFVIVIKEVKSIHYKNVVCLLTLNNYKDGVDD